MAPGLFLSDKELRKARQAAVAGLQALRDARAPSRSAPPEEAAAWMDGEALDGLQRPRRRAAIRPGGPPVSTCWCGNAPPWKPWKVCPCTPSTWTSSTARTTSGVEAVRGMGFRAGIATTRILKPAEHHNLKVIGPSPRRRAGAQPGGPAVAGRLGPHLAGDFSLNVSNSLTAAYLAGKGLASLCPSYDLNQWQLFDLLDAMSGRGRRASRSPCTSTSPASTWSIASSPPS